jgi:hypothetical protein
LILLFGGTLPAGPRSRPETRTARRELVVYWKGQFPSGTQKIVEQQRQSIPIRVLPSADAQKELLAVAAKAAAGIAAVQYLSVAHTVRGHVRPSSREPVNGCFVSDYGVAAPGSSALPETATGKIQK